jgi:aryl carrier-like protein
MPTRTIIIGDVHGMLVELKDLLAVAGLSSASRVVFVGDLVDKGPDSCGVVAFARSLREQGVEVVLVQGNHEEKHARFRKAFAAAGEKGVRKFKGVEELQAITEGLSPEDVAFLDSAVPLFVVPEHDAVVVHGGVLPVWDALDASNKGLVSRLLRVRHVTGKTTAKVTVEYVLSDVAAEATDLAIEHLPGFADSAIEVRRKVQPKGSFISLGQETDEDPFWADVYEGRFGHVYFGHSPFIGSEPARFPHAAGLDTGAVFGGSLTAAVLEEGQEPRFVSVPASGKFATSFWEE